MLRSVGAASELARLFFELGCPPLLSLLPRSPSCADPWASVHAALLPGPCDDVEVRYALCMHSGGEERVAVVSALLLPHSHFARLSGGESGTHGHAPHGPHMNPCL